MSVTFTLVEATPFRLRYLCTSNGGGETFDLGTLPNDGGATPDLQTDAITGAAGLADGGPGPMLQIVNAGRNGIGPVAAGALTQNDAQAILLSDDAQVLPAVLTNEQVPRAVCHIQPRSGDLVAWQVNANVDGQNDPVLDVVAELSAASPPGGEAYLDIFVRHTYDL